MTATEALDYLRAQGITLHPAGKTLRVSPRHLVTPAVSELIQIHKSALLTLLCTVGFLLLCQAIAAIGNHRPERCPRHGCNLLRDPYRPDERVQACYLCVEEAQRDAKERLKSACSHCGGSLQGTHPFVIVPLCLPCQQAREAYEAEHPDRLIDPILDIRL